MPDTIEVRIEKLVYGGEGLGHYEGHAVFAPFVLPGEIAQIQPLERRKKFIRGRAADLARVSPDRAAAPCPHFGVCGGCHYQHIPYELQLRYKAEILRETLARLGRVRWDGPIVEHPSPPFGYRNRAQWKIGASRSASAETASPAIGYYEAGTQRLCAIEQCPITSPLIFSALTGFLHLSDAGKLPPSLREIEAFADAEDARLLLNLDFEGLEGSGEDFVETIRAELPAVETILLHDRHGDRFALDGPGSLAYRVGDHAYQVGHLSFFQLNRFLLPQLPEIVLGDARGSLALDLFAGVGLFTIALAHRFQRVIGVESNVAAARDLEANLRQSGAASLAFRPVEVERFLERWRETPDLVVLDPPRAGVPAQALARLASLAPPAITYLSCDPATLARDLAALAGTAEKPGRYQISEVHLVDIFPQTYHIEALVRLSRRA